MLSPTEIRQCEDLEELEWQEEIAHGHCVTYNCCDEGCRCWNENDLCDYRIITERIRELLRKKEEEINSAKGHA